jgi:hypothetical protein
MSVPEPDSETKSLVVNQSTTDRSVGPASDQEESHLLCIINQPADETEEFHAPASAPTPAPTSTASKFVMTDPFEDGTHTECDECPPPDVYSEKDLAKFVTPAVRNMQLAGFQFSQAIAMARDLKNGTATKKVKRLCCCVTISVIALFCLFVYLVITLR